MNTNSYCFSPQDGVGLHILGSDRLFPVGRVFCVGRNYADHAREMGKDPHAEPPFFFMKPASAVVPLNLAEAVIDMPSKTSNYQHEVELVVALGKPAFNVTPDEALECIWGYAVGLDMTRRDLQLAARDAGRPWEFGKSFAQSAPIGALTEQAAVDLRNSAMVIRVNGDIRQSTRLDMMIWDAAHSISYLSAFDPLLPGDLLMTGTPAGVGAVLPGDVMEASISGLQSIRVRVRKAATHA